MASYSYGGLQVTVQADTRQLARQIAQDATAAGRQAGATLTAEISKGAAAGGKQAGATLAAEISRGVQQAGAALTRAFDAMQTAASRAAAAAGQALERDISAASSVISTGLSRVFDAVQAAADRAASAASAAWARVAQAGEVIQAGLSRVWDAVSGAASRAAAAAGDAFSRMAAAVPDAITGGLGRAWDAVTAAAGRAADAASSAFARVGGAIGSAISEAAGRAWDAVTSAAGRAADAASSAWGRVAEAGTTIASGLGRAFDVVAPAAGRAAGAAAAAFSRVGEAGNPIQAGLSRAFDTAASAAGRAAETAKKAWSAIGDETMKAVKGAAMGVGAAMLGVGAYVVKTGVGYNQLEQSARAAFTTILGSGEAANGMMDRLTAFAKTQPFPRQAYIEAAQLMTAFGIEADKTVPYLKNVSDAVAAAGRGTPELQAITRIMGEISAAGKITGVDLNQMANYGINAAKLIGDAMGKTEQEIRQSITSGSLDAGAALDALSKGMEINFAGASANLKKTWVGAVDSLKGSLRDLSSGFIEPFISKGGGGLLVEWVSKLAAALRNLVPTGGEAKLKPLIEAFMKGLMPALEKVTPMLERFGEWTKNTDFSRFTGQIERFAPLITGAGVALAGFTGAAALSKIPLIGQMFEGLGGITGKLAGTIKDKLVTSIAEKGLGGTLTSTAGKLTIFGAAFGLLMAVSPEFRAAVMEIVKALASALMPILKSLLDAIKPLIPVFVQLAQQIGAQLAAALRQIAPLIGPLAQLLGQVLAIALRAIVQIIVALMPVVSALIPVIGVALRVALAVLVPILQAVIGVLRFLSPILGPLIIIIAAVVLAIKIWTIVQWALNSALLANPITWIVIAIIALVAGIVWLWNRFEGFRNFIKACWDFIVNVFKIAWTVISTIITTYWNAVWKPIFMAIGTFFVWVWNTILKPCWDALVVAFQAIGDALKWVWDTILWPVFNALGTFFRWVWDTLLWPVLSALGAAFAAVGAALQWVWDNILWPVFNALGQAAMWVWNNFLKPMIDGTKNLWELLGAAFMWVWSTLIKPVWDALAAAAMWVWNTVIQPVVGFIRDAWDWVWNAVSTVVRNIVNFVREWWYLLIGIIGGPLAIIIGLVIRYWDQIVGWITGAVSTIWNAISGAFTRVRDFLGGIWNAITGTVVSVWNMITNWIRHACGLIWDTISGAFSRAAGWVGEKVTQMWQAVVGLAQKWWQAGQDATRRMWEGIRAGLGNAWDWVWRNILEPIINAVRQLPGKLLEIGKDVASGLLNGIKDGLKNIGSFIGDLVPGPIKKFLGIGSPSRLFAQIGSDSAAGFLQGLWSQGAAIVGTFAQFGTDTMVAFNEGLASQGQITADTFASIVAGMTASAVMPAAQAAAAGPGQTGAEGTGVAGAAAAGAAAGDTALSAYMTQLTGEAQAMLDTTAAAIETVVAQVTAATTQIQMMIVAAFLEMGAIVSAVMAQMWTDIVLTFDQIVAYFTATWWLATLTVANAWAQIVGDTAGALGTMWLLISGAWDGWLAYTAAVWGQIWLTVANTWAMIVADTAGAMATMYAILAQGWVEIANLVALSCARMVADVSGALEMMRQAVFNSHNGIRDHMIQTWDAIFAHVTGRLSALVDALRRAFDEMRAYSASSADWIRNMLADTWNRIHDNAREGWQRTVDTISRVWDQIREAIANPIRYVVNEVINKFIGGLNGLITKVGEDAVPTINLGFARGGRVPGAGNSDSVPAMLTPGEWVLTKRQARAIGYGRLAGLPRYARGGYVGRRPNLDVSPPYNWERFTIDGDSKTIRLSNLPQLAGLPAADLLDQYVEDKFAADVLDAFEELAVPYQDAVKDWDKHGSVFPERYIGKEWPEAVELVLDWFYDELCAAAWGFGTGDWEGGANGIVALAKVIMERFPGLRVSSFVRPGDPGYHGRGWAQDLAGPVPVMNAAGEWVQANMVGALLEGIHRPAGGQTPLSIKNYAAVPPSFWGPGTWAGHADHLHLAADPNRTAPAAGGGGGGDKDKNERRQARRSRGSAEFGTSMGAGDGGLPFGGSIANLTAIAKFFMSAGYSKAAAAGMAGNIGQESGGNPLISGTGGRGLIGWTPPSTLPDSAWVPGNFQLSMQRQLEQIVKVYNQIWKQYIPRLNAARSAAEAAQIYCTYFERAGIPAMGNRIRWANMVYERLANGGIIREPVIGVGQRSGHMYEIAERGPEMVSPLRGPNSYAGLGRAGAQTVINVYPQPGQDERQIAAAVSRELAWAAATGAR